MNTLSDLRRTLDQHAERVPDGETVVRTAAVRHRVSVVRRRRLAVAAGALALVVATGFGAVGVKRASSNPPPVVFGVRAPETLTSLGYTYRSDGRADTFAGRGSLKVSASSAPRLFSWTTDRATRVRIVLPNGQIWTSDQTRFTDFVQVPAGQSGTLRVSVPSGSVGLASYVLTDVAPAGYTKDGITFRQNVAVAPLLGAIITDRGQVDASTTFVAPLGQVALHFSCTGLPKGDALHVSFNGSERTAGDCNDPTTFDPGASWGSQFSVKHPGRRVVLRVWATSATESSSSALRAGEAPDLRIYVGAYGPVDHVHVGGYRVDRYVEQDGHLWDVQSSASTSTRAHPTVTLHPTGYQGPAAMAWNTRGLTGAFLLIIGMPAQTGVFSGGQGAIGDLWVPLGATGHYGLTRGNGTFGIALYQRAD